MILIDPPAWPAWDRVWSHLASDVSYDELHDFARKAGIPARGFDATTTTYRPTSTTRWWQRAPCRCPAGCWSGGWSRPGCVVERGVEVDLKGFAGLDAVVGVSHRGRWETAATGVEVGTPFRIASLTKTLTAAATVRALLAKGFAVDVPVAEVLPELETELTVAQVLSQSTGLRQAVDAGAAAALGSGDDVFLAAAKLVVDGGLEYQPGERWAYYNGNYFLAGALLARLSGGTYEDGLGELILAAGLESTGFEPSDGYPRARRPSGGLWSTVPDLLTFCEFLLRDKGLLTEIARPRVMSPLAYGLGWAVGPAGMLYLNGRLQGYRAAMLLAPREEWAAVMLVADTDALPAIAQYLDELQRPLTGVPMARLIDDFAA
jgi:CubicO group peptidase (beta-lactamase class C family)